MLIIKSRMAKTTNSEKGNIKTIDKKGLFFINFLIFSILLINQ